MVSEPVALWLDETDGFRGSADGGVWEAVGGDAHVAVGVGGVQVEDWIKG